MVVLGLAMVIKRVRRGQDCELRDLPLCIVHYVVCSLLSLQPSLPAHAKNGARQVIIRNLPALDRDRPPQSLSEPSR